MKDVTLAQSVKLLTLIEQKKTPCEQIQDLLASGLFSDLLDANFGIGIDRDEFRRVLGLSIPRPTPPSMIIVDTDIIPYHREWMEEVDHLKMGKMTLEKRADGKLYANDVEVLRYRSTKQESDSPFRSHSLQAFTGHQLREEFQGRNVLNARILQALVVHPQLVPDDWRKGVTCFWGTTFRDQRGEQFVEYFIHRNGYSSRQLDCVWDDYFYSAELAC